MSPTSPFHYLNCNQLGRKCMWILLQKKIGWSWFVELKINQLKLWKQQMKHASSRFPWVNIMWLTVYASTKESIRGQTWSTLIGARLTKTAWTSSSCPWSCSAIQCFVSSPHLSPGVQDTLFGRWNSWNAIQHLRDGVSKSVDIVPFFGIHIILEFRQHAAYVVETIWCNIYSSDLIRSDRFQADSRCMRQQ